MKKLSAYLQLVRLPNIFTAVADVLAGYFLVTGGRVQDPAALSGLLLASAGIYAAGCALNDLHDREEDAVARPTRPIPAGKVSVPEVWGVVILLFAGSVGLALLAGSTSFFMAVPLVLLVIAYDTITKDMVVLGPLTMGGCRALNLLFGMSCGLTWEAILIFPLLSLVYVFSLTLLSRFETGGNLGNTGKAALAGIGSVVLLLFAGALSGAMKPDSLIFLLLLIVFAGPAVVAGVAAATPEALGKAVKYLVLAIPLLDAVYVSGVYGWQVGLPVALCLVPALVIARYMYVT